MIFSWIDIEIRFNDPELLLSNSLKMNQPQPIRVEFECLNDQSHAHMQ